ncbi:MAG: hypothetical protein HC881_06725 [Leptolyngbyaceae cyanobacterium SL_7_1]|nr:hypothetical protein [Leptolyngbyaceae cyanobacterium SL_7_1]
MSDLIGAGESSSANLTELLHEPIDAPPAEDDYIVASPDETLLVSDPAGTDRTEIRLPANVLQQLTADLSSLEGLDQEGMASELDLSRSPMRNGRWHGRRTQTLHPH